MRITTRGQVTIPVEIRERLGMHPDTEVEFSIDGDSAVIRKARKGTGRGKRIVAEMIGRGTGTMSTDEIMALMRGR